MRRPHKSDFDLWKYDKHMRSMPGSASGRVEEVPAGDAIMAENESFERQLDIERRVSAAMEEQLAGQQRRIEELEAEIKRLRARVGRMGKGAKA